MHTKIKRDILYYKYIFRFLFFREEFLMIPTLETIQSILEVAPVGIYIVGHKGNIEYANANIVINSGDSYEELSSLNIFEAPGNKSIGLDEKIKAVFNGESFILKEVEYTSHFSGKKTINNFIGIPLFESGEKKAIIFVEDITYRKRTEEELLKTTETKTRFLSMASHELRTPLAVVGMYISSVLSGAKGPITADQKNYLESAERNVEKLVSLINDLLDYQKMNAGKMPMTFASHNINEVIEETAKDMILLVRKKGLYMNLFLDRTIGKINFDREKIRQVLVNIINNALKFTNKGGIEIHSKELKRNIYIEIKDTGVGIKKEDLPKLFHTFTRIQEKVVSANTGSGLGLSISKNIMEEHRGKITVKSEYEKGSSFSIFLPKRAGNKEAVAQEK
ncbi:PAS/PAC sensor signal transduction histidine kinase [Candidatus Omnitrophus magneticus]|uniref:histidine kinase n=1 Tax=Candidatus Omnitrophus magneticus TaxID=1609969 RepID=A0A0F0CLW6_9BACT|nr:PAS/PAC sensor signal transduction histidine kinase [Candidatus Omnitrophus magneticus]